MRTKFLSRRALGLHVVLIAWLTGCVLAASWQISRAIDGNSLSYLYSMEWPVIGVFGVLGWYALLNTERHAESDEVARRQYEDSMRERARWAREAQRDEEDPALAAYNDHLAELAEVPKRRLWGH